VARFCDRLILRSEKRIQGMDTWTTWAETMVTLAMRGEPLGNGELMDLGTLGEIERIARADGNDALADVTYEAAKLVEARS